MIPIKDSRGKDSLTLGFIFTAFIVGNLTYIYSVYKTGNSDLVAYGAFIFGNLIPWIAREHTEKNNAKRLQEEN